MYIGQDTDFLFKTFNIKRRPRATNSLAILNSGNYETTSAEKAFHKENPEALGMLKIHS